ncbi:MAG TPA: DUF11 domain-containing protein, partial [Chloroflexi bacterium]|nr:DUF11 domain-containing protein [Chloroflexota bacterium]
SAPATATALPAWYTAAAAEKETQKPATASPHSALPAWFEASQPKSPQPAPVQRNQIFREISNSLLTVNVFGPASASIGAPPGEGEIYTAVIRNDSSSSDVAYSVYLTATHQSFMVYDGFSELVSSSGVITPLTVVETANAITWTLPTTYNLAAGEAITLRFKLRAECNGVSGQRLEVGVNYNADPPPAGPTETNVGGLNVTLGRGNLVINKYPALQALGTGDFGKPITWTVEVQNTGLGKIYDAVITDTGGISLSQPTGDLTPTDTITVLNINETRSYTVVGTVEACNFTNVAEGAWPCGNIEGDGYYTNPVTSTVSVLFNPDVPNVSLDVSARLDFDYCEPVSRTVTITATDLGGAAGDLRIASNLANHGFLEILTGTVGGDWSYDAASGRFSYQGGPPTGTLMAGEAVTLTFQVQPHVDVCSAGEGSLTFTPLYRDICANEPFTGAIRSLAYEYAQGEAPTLAVSKSGPSVVASGETFVYTVTLSGSNAQNISGTIYVTDTLPTGNEFALQGDPIPSTGAFTVTNGVILWTFPATYTISPFSETLIYQVKAITVTGGVCGAGEQVNNRVVAFAQPTCDACDVFTPTAQVDTIIVNQEGVIPAQNAVGAFEVCGEQGFIITNRYEITGSTVVTWAGAVFTEALGTDIGAGAFPSGTVPLEYRNALSVVIEGVDYTNHVTETVIPGGPLVLDLGGLHGLAPTQTFVLYITYTVGISEASLNGEVEQTFYDWTQLYLPNSHSDEVCADNSAFNQALELTISRGDLSVGLSPPVLNRCETNRAVIQVNDIISGALTNRIVVTFTSSSEQITTARNFTYTGSLVGISPITVTSGTIGGGRSVLTFTLPPGQDLDGDGTIEFDIDVGCTGDPPWRAGITFESRCGFPHRHANALPHDYRAPSLILFATPIRYTLREREPTWKFFVTNNGNLTATHVVVTNTASGLTITTFVADGDDITAALPARTGVFTIGEIAPGQQRAVTVTAEAFSCTPLGVDIAARLDCFDDLCGYREATIDFITPRPYLRTNNGQTADLPMCDLGRVVFTTKNASPDVNLYQINITETLQQLTPAPGEPFTVTVLDKDNKPVATTTAFDPISKTVWGEGMNAVTTTLQWWAHLAPTEVATWFQELPPLYTVRITVPVRISCVAPNAPTGHAAASAEETCGTRFSRSENAVTFQTKEPNLDVLKDGRVDEEDSEWGKTVYATPGQTVTWRLQVINPSGSRAHVAENVVLSDTWPASFDFITATTSYTYHIQDATRTITWEVGDVALDVENLYFYITGTVVATPTACLAQTTNRTSLKFGCDDGCTHDETPVDSANLYSAPILNVALTPETFSICEGDIELTIRNEGARAYSSTLTVTMPSGYQVYTYTLGPDAPTPVSVTLLPDTAPEFYWDELPGRISADPYFFTMTLRVQNTGASGACPGIEPKTVTATLGYDDHAECTDSKPYSDTNTASLIVGEPNLVVSKEPAYQTAAVGDRVTWTLRVANVISGDTAPATNVVVTDVVGTNYITVVAGNGSDGVTPTTSTIAAGTLITWAPADIAVGGVWTATVSAALDDTGDNRNVVTATAFCDTGCASATSDASAHTTLLLEDFTKHPAVQTGTIGSLTVFTFAATLQDRDALYEDLTITDTLPVGLGYVSSTLVYTYAGPATPTPAISHTPTITPGYLASGDVVWQLGNLSGTVEIAGVITAVVRAIPENYDGMRWTNVLTLTYTDDVGNYVYTGTAAVDVLEPILHIGKTYVTPRGCEATLLEDNFNVSNTTTPPFGNWSRVNASVEIVDGLLHLYGSGDVANSAELSDFSISWMGYKDTANANNADLWLVFRMRGDWNQNSYIFEWMDTQYRLRRYLNNTSYSFGTVGSAPGTGQWVHFEIRAEGDRIRVYADGQMIFDVPDDSHASGSTQIRTTTGSDIYVDDVLVTRLDDMACTVGANDLVTYTLTISNQGRLPGYDLVVTDTLPGGMSLVTYTFESDDPATVTDTQPSPIPGATGDLVWGFNQLAPADPFNPLNHTAITMTVVLSVADWITANTVLPNQAALAYD